jgi:hypothetical protein
MGRVIADWNERCKELAPQVSGSLAMQSIAEAEQKSYPFRGRDSSQRTSALLNP